MFAVPILLGFGCLVSLWFAMQSPERESVPMVLLLAALLVAANLLWFTNSLDWLPALDFCIGIFALGAAIDGKSWALKVVVLFYIRLAAHLGDMLTAHAFFVGYAMMINALYALLLLVVAEPGGKHGFDRLRRIRDRYFLGPLGAAPGAKAW